MIETIRSFHPHDVHLSAHLSMTVNDLWRLGTMRLADAQIPQAEREARWILECVLGVDRLAFHLAKNDGVPKVQQDCARVLFDRRARREPLQYILGSQEFCGLEFCVDPHVLIPRPETELLVELVHRLCRDRHGVTIADIGTGSGCIAVALASILPTANILAIDRSEQALAVARQNAVKHGVEPRILFEKGDLFEPIQRIRPTAQFTVIVSNPPYISRGDLDHLQPEVRYEPRSALDGGLDGLLFHRRLVKEAGAYLQPDGFLALEVGQGQAAAVCVLAKQEQNYYNVRILKDEAGIDRVVYLQKKLVSTSSVLSDEAHI